jgi:hypothetical protein
MSISSTKKFYVVIAFFVGLYGYSQESFESLGESAFLLNHKVSNNYRIHFATRTRYYIFQRDDFHFKNRQIDFVHFSTLALNYNHSLSFGIQYRFREDFDDGNNELRLTQQFNYTKRNYAVRFGHRARLEQRILDDLTIIRYRYRFALDFPFNGEKLDIGEGYFVGSMEALLSQSTRLKPELDHRTTVLVGWLLSTKLRLQAGLEYRFEAFNVKTQQSLFILTSAILNI